MKTVNTSSPITVNPNKIVQLFLLAWLVLNLLQGIFTGLANDEAYYWFVCRPLAWGFFDHPPMVSLLTFLGINLFGDTEIGVRFFHILLQPIYLYIVWTMVRGVVPAVRTAWIFCAIAFSIPLLQLYGFVAGPNAPLMMSVVLTFWSYGRFVDPQLNMTTGQKVTNALLLGASFALIGYSKYHGALVFALIVCSNIKLIRDWRFWTACLWALLLFAPHLLWQVDHNWVSVRYHLVDRNSSFAWWYVGEYLLNIWGTFNPFLLPIFVVILISKIRSRKRSLMVNAMLWVAWGFLGLFLVSTMRGHVQPQWLVPVLVPMLYFMVRSAERHPKWWPWIRNTSIGLGTAFLVVRVFIMTYSGDRIQMGIFNNEAQFAAIDSALEGRPVVLAGEYTLGAKLDFYTRDTTRAFARPSFHGRNHQWGMISPDTRWYGQKVAVELSGEQQQKIKKGELDARQFQSFTYRGNSIYFDTVDFYIPTHLVRISVDDLPDKILIGQVMALNLTIENPYDFDIPIGPKNFMLIMQFRQGRFVYNDTPVSVTHTVLPARSVTRVMATTQSPAMDTGDYLVGFALQKYPFDTWYNSERINVSIVNPKSRL